MTVEVVLSKPILAHGEQVTKLAFRPLRLKDLRGVQVSASADGLSFDIGALIDIAARLASVPPSALDELGVADLVEIAGKVLPLLDGLTANGTASPPSSPSDTAGDRTSSST